MLQDKLFSTSLRLVAIGIPLGAAWFLLAEQLLLPVLTVAQQALLSLSSDHLFPQILLTNEGDWVITTRVAAEASAAPGSAMLMRVQIPNVSQILLALPLLWAAALAVPHHRLQNLINGSLLMTTLLLALYWAKIQLNLLTPLSGDGNYQVYDHARQIFVYPRYPASLLKVFALLWKPVSFFVVFILPLLLVYAQTRPFWSDTTPRQG